MTQINGVTKENHGIIPGQVFLHIQVPNFPLSDMITSSMPHSDCWETGTLRSTLLFMSDGEYDGFL